jgi:hypothetical protein
MSNKEKGANKIGRLVDSKGETLVEFFGPPSALSKDADILSQGLYALSEFIIRGLPDTPHGCGCLGGTYGYGPKYENDIFAMRPDYMDAKCTCGFREIAEAWHEAHPHSDSCYHTEVYRIDFDDHEARRKCDESCVKRDKFPWLSKEADEVQKEVEYWSNKHRKWQDSVLKKLCKKHSIPWNKGYGCMVHCDCGQEELREKFFEENNHIPTCELVLPNFYHKKSGLEVRWYKWIGRDMEINRDKITVGEVIPILKECFDSLPAEAIEKAKAEIEYENTPEYKAEQEEMMRRVFSAINEMVFNEGDPSCPST